MTTQSLLKEISENNYSKATIQALVSQVKLGLIKFNAEMQELGKHARLFNLVQSVIFQWKRIEATFEFNFPKHFIESALFSSFGDDIKPTIYDLGLEVDLKLSKALKDWLSE